MPSIVSRTAGRLRPVIHLLLLAGAAAGVAAREVPDTLAERVQPCTACHGREGRATNQGYYPRIAGKPADYLAAQLIHFRDGRRTHALMSPLVANLSDDYLREIAGHFAALDLPYPPPAPVTASAAELARGRVLVEEGDAARHLPACSRCHGRALTGVQPAMPGLLGLPRDYLVGQFGAWKTGLRHAAAPDCMARIARALDPADVEAVARWLATRPVPLAAQPAASAAQPAPLDCGGLAP